jgi:thioredoxin 1
MEVLKFFASWCPPCKELSTNIDSIKSEITYPIKDIDVDTNRELAQKFNISALPTIILIDNNIEVRRILGVPQEHDLRSFFNLK